VEPTAQTTLCKTALQTPLTLSRMFICSYSPARTAPLVFSFCGTLARASRTDRGVAAPWPAMSNVRVLVLSALSALPHDHGPLNG
jgi:hypothetical protein